MNIDPNVIPAIDIQAGVLPMVLVISAFIAAIISAVRKPKVVGAFVDEYLRDLIPFAAIGLGVLASWFLLDMRGTNALLAGFMIGQISTGNYEFVKRFKTVDVKTTTVVLLAALMIPVAGCGDCRMSKTYNNHLKDTMTTVTPYYLKCSQWGEPNDCAMCLAVVAAELEYINFGLMDPNKPVKMTYKLKQKFQIQQKIASELRERCTKGDLEACRLGALKEFKFLEHVYSGANDVNIPSN